MQFLKCDRNQTVLHNPTDSFKIKKTKEGAPFKAPVRRSEKQLKGVL